MVFCAETLPRLIYRICLTRSHIPLLQRNKKRKRNLASNVCKHAFTDKFNTAIFKRQKESMKNKWTIG